MRAELFLQTDGRRGGHKVVTKLIVAFGNFAKTPKMRIKIPTFQRTLFYLYIHYIYVDKAVPLQAWSGPKGSRKLKFPDNGTEWW